LSFQKKRNETTGLGGVPAMRASCFVAGLPVNALDDDARPVRAGFAAGSKPVRTSRNNGTDANAGEACSRGILLISIQAAIHYARNWPSG
jgi:hypothetical protein